MFVVSCVYVTEAGNQSLMHNRVIIMIIEVIVITVTTFTKMGVWSGL